MTGALDTRMRVKALAVIAKYGKAATWQRDAGTYDESTGKTTPSVSNQSVTITPPQPVDTALVDGVTVLTTDLGFFLAAKDLVFTPAVGDRVTIDSEDFEVVALGKVYSGALVCLWSVACRK